MKSRKKIWALPLVLVTALLLVGLFATAVLATQPGFDIPDQKLTVNDSAGTTGNDGAVEIDLTNVDGAEDGDGDTAVDDEAAFVDTEAPSALAYTALTSDPSIADVALGGDSTSIVTEWWDSLDGTTGEDCSKKAMRLGFTVGEDDNTAATSAIANDEAGLCVDYGTLSGNLLEESSSGVGDEISARVAVLLAFHWDMLSQDEMYEAAEAAKERPTTPYGHNFGALGDDEKRDVEGWFGEDDILAMGIGPLLTLVNDGTDGPDNDTIDPDDKAGTATITVKASDATGRLIPPANGSATVGKTFTVTASLSDAGTLTTSLFATDAGAAGTSTLVAPTDSGNQVAFVPRPSGENSGEHYAVRISPGRDEIASVFVGGDSGDDGEGDYGHNPHQNPINFSLINGGDVAFQVQKTNNSTAEIQVKPSASLTAADSPYKFTLVVNEFSRAPENSIEVDIQVTVVLDNVVPSFVSTSSSRVGG